MKTLKTLIALLFLIGMVACEKDEGDIDFVQNATAPTDVSAKFQVSTDNTGAVTITPIATGVASYKVYFGDSTATPTVVKAGASVTHIYAEGSYQVKVVAVNIAGKEAEATLPLEVSFRAPENVVLTVANDQAVSKKVNVTAKADFAIIYDVYFGESTDEKPVSGNIGEEVSHIYKQTGTYTITVEVKGAGKQTTKVQKQVQVIALQQPTTSAPKQPIRKANEVVSLFSGGYTNVANSDFNPNWGQATAFNLFKLGTDEMLQYADLNYQGIQFAQPIDLSAMEYLHLDVWTADATALEIYLISNSTGADGEKFVKKTLTADKWTSLDIPLTDYTKQGFVITDVHQIKLVGSGTVFIDNLYFYKKSATNTVMIEDFEGTAPEFTTFGNMAKVEVVANPNKVGNTTNKVVKMVRTAGCETWAGAFFASDALDMNTYKVLKLKALSPKAGITVKAKLENAAGDVAKEVNVRLLQKDVWQELSFDFSDIDATETYTKVVVFFDFGETGDDTTYYYDEITLTDK
ncbi:hypothetical protein RCZ04_03260 [Capnocytophaga sp. HP1101]